MSLSIRNLGHPSQYGTEQQAQYHEDCGRPEVAKQIRSNIAEFKRLQGMSEAERIRWHYTHQVRKHADDEHLAIYNGLGDVVFFGTEQELDRLVDFRLDQQSSTNQQETL